MEILDNVLRDYFAPTEVPMEYYALETPIGENRLYRYPECVTFTCIIQ